MTNFLPIFAEKQYHISEQTGDHRSTIKEYVMVTESHIGLSETAESSRFASVTFDLRHKTFLIVATYNVAGLSSTLARVSGE